MGGGGGEDAIKQAILYFSMVQVRCYLPTYSWEHNQEEELSVDGHQPTVNTLLRVLLLSCCLVLLSVISACQGLNNVT